MWKSPDQVRLDYTELSYRLSIAARPLHVGRKWLKCRQLCHTPELVCDVVKLSTTEAICWFASWEIASSR
jgi:hypothetical protein